MTVLMKISKSGSNALTETDPNNLIFSSEYGTLKYHLSGTTQLVASGSSVETSITHGLGYVPFFLSYYNSPLNSARFSMTPDVFEGSPNLYSYIDSYADTDKIYFSIHTNTLNATVDFYYKVFRNRLGL